MENISDDILMKVRSSGACIRAGFGLFTGNFRRLFRYSWSAALAFAVVAGMVSTYFVSAYPKLVVSVAQAQAGGLSAPLSVLPLVLICSGMLAVILTFPLLLSYGVSALRMHQSSGVIPRPVRLFSADKHAMWRTVKCWLWLVAIVFAESVVLSVTQALAARFLGETAGVLAVAIVCLAVAIVTVPFFYIAMKYLLTDGKGFWQSFGSNYTTALSHYGYVFVVAVIDIITALVAALVTTLPSVILTSANLQAQAGVLSGDPIGMPGYITWLTFVVFLLAQFIRAYILMSTLFPLYYMYGSIEAQQEDRKSLSRMLKRQQEQQIK